MMASSGRRVCAPSESSKLSMDRSSSRTGITTLTLCRFEVPIGRQVALFILPDHPSNIETRPNIGAARLAEPALRHYALAGGASSLIAVVLTFVVRAGAAPLVLGGQLVVEVLFPLGCALVVWKVRQLAAPLIQTQQGYKAQMRRI